MGNGCSGGCESLRHVPCGQPFWDVSIAESCTQRGSGLQRVSCFLEEGADWRWFMGIKRRLCVGYIDFVCSAIAERQVTDYR